MDSKPRNAAFSLVELSIVLVILGLLTGGILTGQSLIRAAELRSVVTEFQRYQTAAQSFRDKYFAIPGDMRNASTFWGAAGGTTGSDAACYQSGTGTGTATCNGDGDGKIDTTVTASGYGEQFMVWQHMANAGLIEGSYTGRDGAGIDTDDSIPGSNIPRSRASNAAWNSDHLDYSSSSHSTIYAINYGNALYIGGQNNTGDADVPILTPEEAWNIDTKLDDGKPAYGKVIARYYNNSCSAADNNSHTATNFAASYKLADSSKTCILFFKNTF